MNPPAGVTLPSQLWEALFPHQRVAVETATRYLASLSSVKRDEPPEAALVRMPTGTGKSGIISTCTQHLAAVRKSLVVAPAKALCDQLIDDISKTTWTTLIEKVTADQRQRDRFLRQLRSGHRPVHKLLPSSAGALVERLGTEAGVLVCTMAALEDVYRTQPAIHRRLGDLVELVLVDEGHREPAEEWSRAVRALRRPVVLFTATPYRNDHRVFNIQPRSPWVSVLSFRQAIEAHFIRDIEVLPRSYTDSVDGFVEALRGLFGELESSGRLPTPEPRCIVRCENSASVQQVVEALRSQGEKVVGFHETFRTKDSEHGLFRDVPPRGARSEPAQYPQYQARYWVHQWKLLEGIDMPEACVLGIFEPLRNARSLVQQIGRITRNPGQGGGKQAFVLTHKAHRQQDFWQLFLQYEEEFESNPDLFESRLLYDTLVAAMPKSVFGLLDALGKGTGMQPDLETADLLLCDDMGAELADFIAVEENKRIVMIHAKAFRKSKTSSASAFHDVLSQAVKNLDILVPHHTEFHPNVAKWDDPWQCDGQIVRRRIRKPLGVSGEEAWRRIRDTVENPAASREVWIVVGNGFSLGAFERAITGPSESIPPNTLQLVYLVQSAWATVSKLANSFRIYCRE